MSTCMSERLISVSTARAMLGCRSRQHVLNLIRAGAIRAADVRTPGAKRARWVIVPSSVRAFLASRQGEKQSTDSKQSTEPGAGT